MHGIREAVGGFCVYSSAFWLGHSMLHIYQVVETISQTLVWKGHEDCCVYLDDGIGAATTCGGALEARAYVRKTLLNSGFV